MRTIYSTALSTRIVMVLLLYMLIIQGGAVLDSFSAKPTPKNPPWPIHCPVVLDTWPCGII